MIQTDKPKYKPSDSVKMRVFFIRPDGRAETEIRNFHAEIRNKYDEKVDAFSSADFKSKVYTHTYNLGDEPFEGNYTIHVWTNVQTKANEDDGEDDGADFGKYGKKKQNRNKYPSNNDDTTKQMDELDVSKIKLDIKDAVSQNFTVEKYVLTEFTLDVQTKRIVRPYSTINLKISGSYSFGKHVIGTAEVTSKVKHNDKILRIYNVTADIGSKGETYGIVSINTEKHLDLKNAIENYDVDITVYFTDGLSRQKVKRDLKVSISSSDQVKLILDPAEGYLKPGTMFTMNAYLIDIDGKLIESTTKEVYMGVTKKYQLGLCEVRDAGNSRNETYVRVGSEIISEYSASFEVYVPYNTTSLEFKATYDDVSVKFTVARTKDVPVSRHYVNILTEKDV